MDKEEFQKMFDLDGDGDVGQAEMEKAAKMFAMADKDGDGQLTEEEMKLVGWRSSTRDSFRSAPHQCATRSLPLARRSLRRQRRRSRRATIKHPALEDTASHSLLVALGLREHRSAPLSADG